MANIITVEQAKAQGITAEKIRAAAMWSRDAAHYSKNEKDAETRDRNTARFMKQAEALEAVADKL